MTNRLNKLVGACPEVWNKETGKSNAGTYYVQGAYGGYQLERIANDGGGSSNITLLGTKREIYEQMKTAVTVLEFQNKVREY
tara:strand:+ start:379 stop:624 length:246 start_codon:yes stop_codon:yes gene_type:complete